MARSADPARLIGAAADRPVAPTGQNGGVTAPPNPTFYDEIGGHATFVELTARFYAGVEARPDFRAMYPEEDLGPAQERLRMFLEQYWGGPHTYQERRGHPRLRMRHAPFHIASAQAQMWLDCMNEALDGLALTPQQRARFDEYFQMAAHSMINAND